MKKAISFLLALLLMSSSFTFYSPAANALGAVWVKDYYKDKFGDKTDQYYLTNKSQFNGTYNSDSVSNGELGANLIFERDGEVLLAYLTLFLNGMDQLKNSASSNDYYDISVKRADGSVFDTNGSMVAGENRIRIDASMELAQALRANNGVVKIYIEDSYYKNNNYLFTVECGNFNDLYNQEILVPYQEEKYQEAEHLLKEKKYDEATAAFEALSGYKDSATRVEEVIEAKNADTYAKAEELLSQKKYDEATDAFKSLGDYKDSVTRAEEAVAAKKLADTYKSLIESCKAGNIETILFGEYEQDGNASNGKEPIEWIVLDGDGTNLLLLSRYVLDKEAFENVWEFSSLRSKLNNDFYNSAFKETEKAIIINSCLKNGSAVNGEGTTVGGNDTYDKVFLLSADEVKPYLYKKEICKCEPTEYAKSCGIVVGHIGYCGWYLRTPGTRYFYVSSVTAMGKMTNTTHLDQKTCGIRPAIWVDLGILNMPGANNISK